MSYHWKTKSFSFIYNNVTWELQGEWFMFNGVKSSANTIMYYAYAFSFLSLWLEKLHGKLIKKMSLLQPYYIVIFITRYSNHKHILNTFRNNIFLSKILISSRDILDFNKAYQHNSYACGNNIFDFFSLSSHNH